MVFFMIAGVLMGVTKKWHYQNRSWDGLEKEIVRHGDGEYVLKSAYENDILAKPVTDMPYVEDKMGQDTDYKDDGKSRNTSENDILAESVIDMPYVEDKVKQHGDYKEDGQSRNTNDILAELLSDMPYVEDKMEQHSDYEDDGLSRNTNADGDKVGTPFLDSNDEKKKNVQDIYGQSIQRDDILAELLSDIPYVEDKMEQHSDYEDDGQSRNTNADGDKVGTPFLDANDEKKINVQDCDGQSIQRVISDELVTKKHIIKSFTCKNFGYGIIQDAIEELDLSPDDVHCIQLSYKRLIEKYPNEDWKNIKVNVFKKQVQLIFIAGNKKSEVDILNLVSGEIVVHRKYPIRSETKVDFKYGNSNKCGIQKTELHGEIG
ncbi:uncharacterized protein LOC144342135 [Saccoglossus kowalevskii]